MRTHAESQILRRPKKPDFPSLRPRRAKYVLTCSWIGYSDCECQDAARQLKSMQLGYIYIHRLPPAASGSYYLRTIHNPNTPIHEHVKTYFAQRRAVQRDGKYQLFLRATEDLRFRIEFRINGDPRTPERRYQLFVQDNPYYTTYTVNEEMFRGLELILRRDVQLSELSAPNNQAWILDLIYKGLVHVSRFPFARSYPRGATEVSADPPHVH